MQEIVVQPTEEDILNATTYCEQRLELYKINVIRKQLPNIRIITEIRAATQDDYKFPSKLRDNAILVQGRVDRKSCQMLNCWSRYPRGKECTKSDTSKLFMSGNFTQLACQPACFNLNPNSDKNTPQSFPTFFFPPYNACIIENPTILAYMIDDYVRTTEHPTKGVDTIGTGFDRENIDAITENNFIEAMYNSDGFYTPRYKLNTYYCDRLYLPFRFREPFNECDRETVKLFGWDSTIRYDGYLDLLGGRFIPPLSDFFYNGSNAYTVWNPKVPPINYNKYPDYVTLKEKWAEPIKDNPYVDINVKLSQLGITSATRHMTWTNEFSPEGQLVEPLLVYTSVPDGNFAPSTVTYSTPPLKVDYTKRRNYKDNKAIPPNLALHDYGFFVKLQKPSYASPLIDPADLGFWENAFMALFSKENLKNLVLYSVSAKTLLLLRTLLIKGLKRIIPTLIVAVTKMITSKILSIIITRILVSFMIRFAIMIAARLATIIALTFSIVGIPLAIYSIVTSIIDIAFYYFDFLGSYHNQLEQTSMHLLHKTAFQSNQEVFGEMNPLVNVDFVFGLLWNALSKESDREQIDSDILDLKGSSTSNKRSKRAVPATDPNLINFDKVNNYLSDEKTLQGVNKNGEHQKGKVGPEDLQDQTDIQQLSTQISMNSIIWTSDYMVNSDVNSAGQNYNWQNLSTEIQEPVTKSNIKKLLDSVISDEFIDNLIYTEGLKSRMDDATKYQKWLPISLTSVIAACILQNNILVFLMTFVMVGLIVIHNFYITYDGQIEAKTNLEKIILRELTKIKSN